MSEFKCWEARFREPGYHHIADPAAAVSRSQLQRRKYTDPSTMAAMQKPTAENFSKKAV